MFIVFIIFLVIYLLSSYIMFLVISKKYKGKLNLIMLDAVNKSIAPYKDKFEDGKFWINKKIKSGETESIFIKSEDNLKLHGLFISNKNSKGIIILFPGYRGTVEVDLYPSCRNYYDLGYSILLVDQRACGKSEGKYITFGVKESIDVACWCKYINRRFKSKPIILGGISMGATSILMSLKYINKDMNVKGLIADSGFIFPYDEVLYCINYYFHLDGRIFIGMINMWCMLFAKFSLKERNVICSLKNTSLPILLIHGEDDDFVPIKNSKIMYDNYDGEKKLITFSNASHGISYLVDSKRYLKEIKMFLDKNAKK